VARQAYNACLSEALRRLDLLRQSKAYQSACKLPKGEKGSPAAKFRTKAFREVNARFGFREYDLIVWTTEHIKHEWLGEHLDSNTIQKLATRAFLAAEQYALGKRGRPRFKGRNQMDTVEGKDNESGIRWRGDRVEWSCLSLPAIINPADLVVRYGLACHVKYVRLVRRKLNGRNRFYAQLICEGMPYRKPQNTIGQGTVGLDIGPSTIAVVAPEARTALLETFCGELESKQKTIRLVQRKLDRQQRANNPQNYNPNGTIKKGARGTKVWRKSGRQLKTQARLAEIHRRQAAHRKSLHGQMVNRILKLGNVIKLEKLSYYAFQRSFGKSVGFRAPGMFVAHLRRKAASADASVDEFPTRTTRLSQLCHGCGSLEPKPLWQRWHVCQCGVVAQRDLYSAFLATCVQDARLDAGRAAEAWPGVDSLLQAASSCPKPASGGLRVAHPSPDGQGRSRSPVTSSTKVAEAREVVLALRQGEPGRDH
jgi:transposase